MAVLGALVMAPIGIVFVISGLIVNFIQGVLLIVIRPFSKNVYRRLNKIIAELLWLELIWLIDWWAGIKIDVHADSETFELLGKEHALVISNHRSDIDWLVGWVLAQRSGCLGSTLAIMKKEAKFLPIIGWSMWFSDYVFLEINWVKDEAMLKSSFRRLEDCATPFWLALFVEGARFTQPKLVTAQSYAASKGLHVPRHVLVPRTKGFVSAVSHLRSFVPAIYDCTVAISNAQTSPSLLRIFDRKSSTVKVQIKRHLMQELPKTEDGIAQWCRDIFVTKDAMLEKYFTEGIFSDLEIQEIGRPTKSLLVVICWSSLVVCGIVSFLLCFALLSSWQGIAISGAFVIFVILIMQILVISSESKRSKLHDLPQAPIEQALIQTYT